MIALNRSQAFTLFNIAHTNLLDSKFDITTDEAGLLYATVTSPTAPGARRVYEVLPEGGSRIVVDEGFIDGLLRQNTDEPEN